MEICGCYDGFSAFLRVFCALENNNGKHTENGLKYRKATRESLVQESCVAWKSLSLHKAEGTKDESSEKEKAI